MSERICAHCGKPIRDLKGLGATYADAEGKPLHRRCYGETIGWPHREMLDPDFDMPEPKPVP